MKDNNTQKKLLNATFFEVYFNGYHGAAIDSILKRANVPKGSMYHFFDSKKDLVLCTIEDRIFPKMDDIFNFTKYTDETIFQTLERIFVRMSENDYLITHGCPLHRLMVEMAPLDKDFEKLLTKKFDSLVINLASLFELEISNNKMINFDTRVLARFMITSIWGEISLPPTNESEEYFLLQTKFLLMLLKSYCIK